MANLNFDARFLGTVTYEQGECLQMKAWDEVRRAQKGVILGLEHEATITLGKSAKLDEELLSSTSMAVVKSDRGGQATLHSPGQLVIYPILQIAAYGGVRAYVEHLGEVTSTFLKIFEVASEYDHSAPGLYTTQGKIGFIGIRVDQGISRHGLAINVSNDLTLFSTIRSCGLKNSKLTKLSEFTETPELPELFALWCEQFRILTHEKYC